MYYHGFGTGGHAFNVDGYNGNDYFHFNWGWSGSYNGYFYLDNLNPGGNNFTEGQGAIIDIYPAANYPYYCNSTDTLTTLNGTIEDGSGPTGQYLGNSHCGWLIAPEDSIMNIKFTFHRFDLENSHDYLTIYDGADTTAPILASFTGSDIPATVTGTTNRMFIRFTSDNSGNAGGWFASFSATKAIFCNGVTTLTAPYGSINDGSGSFNYHDNTLCKYKIIPDSAESITLTFNEFNTFDENDFLMIFNMNNNELLAKLFGPQNPGSMTFNTGKLLIMFRSDLSGNAAGWNLDYSTSMHTGISDLSGGIAPEIFPNPAQQLLNIRFNNVSGKPYTLELFDSRGQSLRQIDPDCRKGRIHEQVDVSGLANGVYILRIQTDTGIINRKVTIRH
jgi:hypothetical protein